MGRSVEQDGGGVRVSESRIIGAKPDLGQELQDDDRHAMSEADGPTFLEQRTQASISKENSRQPIPIAFSPSGW